MFNKKLITFLIMLTILGAIGCVDEGTQSTEINDDQLFFEWLPSSIKLIQSDFDEIPTVKSSGNLTKMGLQGAKLKNDCLSDISVIDSYVLSPSTQNIADEYKTALEDYSKAGELIESYANSGDVSNIENATEYLYSGASHSERVTTMISDLLDIVKNNK